MTVEPRAMAGGVVEVRLFGALAERFGASSAFRPAGFPVVGDPP